ncbi:MAG: putative zinc-binding metallopeptidase [Myroides odoratus]|jgi:substrate import-associated zinc metallohydrolase lipoprotein|nr:putative zinc-binding metallopeptidase [Myroides odoratus]
MKQIFKSLFVLSISAMLFVSCEKDDKLDSNSYIPEENLVLLNDTDKFLYDKFTEPFNIQVKYRWDRNMYGPTRDNNRNLFPPKLVNVKPAFEMVDLVWIQSYVDVAGIEFVKKLRPVSLLTAGGYAFNDDGTRTLGLASGGVQITLYEVDYLEKSLESAQQFIHTIQHEYIHIINQDREFNQPEFSKMNVGSYTTQWFEIDSKLSAKGWTIDKYANTLGFLTSYSRSNSIEDFAETASFMLSKTPEEYKAILDEVRRIDGLPQSQRDAMGLTEEFYKPGGANKIEYKVNFVRDYFKKNFDIDFDELCRVAVQHAKESPMLNRNTSPNGILSTFGVKKGSSFGSKANVRYCQHHADVLKQVKDL